MTKTEEFASSIIDEFEELLVEKGIYIPSEDRKEYENGVMKDNEDGDIPEARIYGEEYYILESGIANRIENKYKNICNDLVSLCGDNIVIAKEIQEYFKLYFKEN